MRIRSKHRYVPLQCSKELFEIVQRFDKARLSCTTTPKFEDALKTSREALNYLKTSYSRSDLTEHVKYIEKAFESAKFGSELALVRSVFSCSSNILQCKHQSTLEHRYWTTRQHCFFDSRRKKRRRHAHCMFQSQHVSCHDFLISRISNPFWKVRDVRAW